jgi:hypothetical protein
MNFEGKTLALGSLWYLQWYYGSLLWRGQAVASHFEVDVRTRNEISN